MAKNNDLRHVLAMRCKALILVLDAHTPNFNNRF